MSLHIHVPSLRAEKNRLDATFGGVLHKTQFNIRNRGGAFLTHLVVEL